MITTMSNGNSLNLSSPRSLLAFAALALALAAAPAHAEMRTLYGTVSYREHVTLPPDAILQVSIVDLSLEPPANVFALTRVRTRNQLPIPYSLRFDLTRARRDRPYALEARILVDGKVWFTTLKRTEVHGPVQPQILVERVAANTEDPTPKGKWLVESIRGAGVVSKPQSTIEIAGDGKVTGNGGCNGFGGETTIADDKISFGALAVTKMACPPQILGQETTFLGALNDARRWLIDDQRGKLILFDAANKEILVLARM
jgi:putative lipoprotein